MGAENNGWSLFASIVVILVLGIAVFLAIGLIRTESSKIEIPAIEGEEEVVGEGFGTQVGQKAINFTLVDQDGDAVSLYDYEGSVILLDLSSAWCPPCRDQAKDSMNLYAAKKERGFVTLTVLMDNMQHETATRSDAQEWAGTYNISYPVLTGRSEWVWNKYNEEGAVPLNLVIDRDLTILYKRTGYDKREIERLVTQLLNK